MVLIFYTMYGFSQSLASYMTDKYSRSAKMILIQNLCSFVTALILLYADQLLLLSFEQCLLGTKVVWEMKTISSLFFIFDVIIISCSLNRFIGNAMYRYKNTLIKCCCSGYTTIRPHKTCWNKFKFSLIFTAMKISPPPLHPRLMLSHFTKIRF